MGERYLITGVQLGMLISSQNEQKRKEIVDSIIDKQFICKTENTDIEEDTKEIINLLESGKKFENKIIIGWITYKIYWEKLKTKGETYSGNAIDLEQRLDDMSKKGYKIYRIDFIYTREKDIDFYCTT